MRFVTGLSCAASVIHQNFRAASTCRMFHGTWCGFDRRSSARDRSSAFFTHACSILSLRSVILRSSVLICLGTHAVSTTFNNSDSFQFIFSVDNFLSARIRSMAKMRLARFSYFPKTTPNAISNAMDARVAAARRARRETDGAVDLRCTLW